MSLDIKGSPHFNECHSIGADILHNICRNNLSSIIHQLYNPACSTKAKNIEAQILDNAPPPLLPSRARFLHKLIMLHKSLLGKRPSAPGGVSPVQWWILTEYTLGTEKYKLEVSGMRGTESSKRTAPQTSSNILENTRDNVDKGQVVSANMPDSISISSSQVQSEITSKENVARSENIGKLLYNKGMYD